MRVLSRIAAIPLTIAAMTLVGASAYAGPGDTPEKMMAVAKEGMAQSADAVTAANQINAMLNRLATDKAYATKVLEAVKKKDANAIGQLLRVMMPRGEVTVGNIASDFHFSWKVRFNSYEFRGCISSDGSCEGHNVTLG